ncbi:hypothetical protein OE88DRAFT_1688026, partial [Heliocybe sulcata]
MLYLDTNSVLPPSSLIGPPVATDMDGAPVYLGVVEMGRGLYPCKVCPRLAPLPVRVPHILDRKEETPRGRYAILHFDRLTMEWVRTSGGRLPEGRTAVEAGHGEDVKSKLFYALADIQVSPDRTLKVPGMCGATLGGCRIPFGNSVRCISQDYDVLCWSSSVDPERTLKSLLLDSNCALPTLDVGPPVGYDLDGSPLYLGAVEISGGLHPCKIAPQLAPYSVRVPDSDDWNEKILRRMVIYHLVAT